MSSHPPVQDLITLVLHEQKTVVHDTVRVNISINAQVDPATSEADFRSEIQSTLRKFIDTEWKIQSIQRYRGNKYENVTVAATARVQETENSRLQERADALTRIGFELVNPTVDYSLTFDEVQAVNAELRMKLLKRVLAETIEINKTFREEGTPSIRQLFRVSNARFDAGNAQMSNAYANAPIMAQAYSISASPSPMPHGGTGVFQEATDMAMADAGESLDLNVSTRFSMTGTFVLSYVVPNT